MDEAELKRIGQEIAEIFRTTRQIQHALEQHFGRQRIGLLRQHITDAGDHFFLSPDFERGKSRIIGLSREVLLKRELTEIARVLAEVDWTARIEETPLYVSVHDGELQVEEIEPDLPEAWFPDPRGGFFFAYPSRGYGLAPQSEHLGLEAETWSARGPEYRKDPADYSFEELQPHIPDGVQAQE